MQDISFKLIPVTIDVSADDNLSSAAKVGVGQRIVGLQIPASMTSTSITFSVSSDNSTYRTLRNYTGAVTLTIGATTAQIALDPADFVGVEWIKVGTGSADRKSGG